jgi:hypothetical protein
LKAKVDDSIKTLVDVPSEFSDRVIPVGTKGTVIESYEQLVEGYDVDIAIPDETQISGYSYDNVILYPDQFVVVNEQVIPKK